MEKLLGQTISRSTYNGGKNFLSRLFFIRFQGHLYTFKWNPILFYPLIGAFVYSLYKSIKVLGSENV